MINYIDFADGTSLQNIKSVVFKGAVNAESDLRPGCVSSGCVTVDVYASESNAPSPGTAIYVEMAGTYIGRFYVEPSISSKNTYSFVAYDAVNKLNVDYSARLAEIQEDFPMTLADLVTDACTVAGVTLDDDQFPMYDMQVQAFYANGITCRDILAYAAEIACCFVRAVLPSDPSDPDTIEFAWYEAAEDLRIYPTSETSGTEDRVAYKQNGLSYSKYVISPPPQVAVKPSGVEGAAYIYPSNVSSVYATDPLGNGVVTLHNLTAIDDGNGNITLSGDFTAADEDSDGNVVMTASGGVSGEPLIISDNILLNGADSTTYEDVAENIYTRMNLIPAFRMANVAIFPTENPFELGQIIPVTDIQGVSFYMLSMSEQINQSVASFESMGNETRASEPSNTAKSLVQLAADIVQINKLKVGWAEIDEAIINTVEANELKSADFEDGTDGIYAAVGMAIDLANKTIKATDFAVTDDGTVYAKGGELAGLSIAKHTTINVENVGVASTSGNTITFNDILVTDTNKLAKKIHVECTSSQTVTVDFTFTFYNASGMMVGGTAVSFVGGGTYDLPVDETLWEATNKVVGKAEGTSSFTCSVSVTYENGRYALQRGTTSIDECNLGAAYYGSDGLAIGNKVRIKQSGRADFGSLYVDGTKLTPVSFSASSGGSGTVSLPNSSRGVIFFSANASGARGCVLFAVNSSGAFTSNDVLTPSGLTLTFSAPTLTVANSTVSTAYGYVLFF